MIKPTLVSDVSVFQHSDLAYFKGLRAMGVRFNFTKLTEDPSALWPYRYVNPRAFPQIRNSLTVFGSAGVYHFWHGQNADFFLSEFKKTGLDPHTTKFMLDVEDTSLGYGLSKRINRYFKQLIDYGFKPGNLWVYTGYATFIQTGRIIVSQLKYGFVWVAKYATMNYAYNKNMSAWSSFRPPCNMWQFNGVGQDLSYDYTGSLLDNNNHKSRRHKAIKSRKIVPKEHYLTHGTSFKALSTLNGYRDVQFKLKSGNVLAKGSVIKGTLVKYGHITRLGTPIGYFSTNSRFLEALK